jgi:hypothetical protein
LEIFKPGFLRLIGLGRSGFLLGELEVFEGAGLPEKR